METVTYDKEITAVLVIDPYNDFISEGGKLWDRVKGVAEANNCVPNMLQVLNAARRAELRVFYAPHHRELACEKTFENGTWGGKIRSDFEPQPGDIVALEHWCSSVFANADLDLQLISSSSSDSGQIRAWSQLFALPLSLATRSRW